MDGRALVLEWAHGWSVSRGARTPVPTEGGVRIELGRSPAASRYVLSDFASSSASRLGDALTVPGSEIKALTGSATLRGCLGDGWVMYAGCELMTSPFARASPAVPAGYTTRVRRAGEVTVAQVRDGAGVTVASARLARWGRYGIVDQGETSVEHRRRGLASVVMAMLGNRAVGDGLRVGLLSATEEGAALYRRLGWAGLGEVAGAVRTGPDCQRPYPHSRPSPAPAGHHTSPTRRRHGGGFDHGRPTSTGLTFHIG